MRSYLKNATITPRKISLVHKSILKYKNVGTVLSKLKYINKKGADILSKCIRSAVSNSKKNIDELVIDNIMIGRGEISYRHIPRGKGNASPIQKRKSNITVILKHIPFSLSDVSQSPVDIQEQESQQGGEK